jgi:hypothetical protein
MSPFHRSDIRSEGSATVSHSLPPLKAASTRARRRPIERVDERFVKGTGAAGRTVRGRRWATRGKALVR